MRGKMIIALGLAVAALAAPASASAADEFDKFAIEDASVSLSTTQAGAHADLTVFFKLTRNEQGPYALTKDVEIELPPGAIGNPQAIPRCTVAQFGNIPSESECPIDSQVGVTAVRVQDPVAGTFTEPIYNMEPSGEDVVARLAFFAAQYPTFLNVRVDPVDYSIITSIEGAPSAAGLMEASSTIWGVPADPKHDEQRITPQEAVEGAPPGGNSANLPPAPFFTNPTDCGTQRELRITARSYQLPDEPSTVNLPFPKITGCGKLSFDASFNATPTNPEAAAPTGLDTTLRMPQDETPGGLATSTLRSAAVTLPEGMSINPAAGQGLEACSAEQVGYQKPTPPACPEAAKIGSVEIEVPALADTLHGSVYQRTPEPGRLFGLWLVADEQGVRLKLPAAIETNPLTGQLTAVFNGVDSLGGIPPVPVSELRLHAFGGPRAPLATPPSCGTYQTGYSFSPWSGKAAAAGQTAMEITSGCGKGGFAPDLLAGTLDTTAGKFSPFTFTLTRQDGEANPSQISVHMPEGLLAKLAGVPLCPDAAAAAGACPAGSRIGALAAASGVGGAPLWIPQPGKAPTAVYLAGPYKGAPYSIVAVVPAQAGPFDLGLVVNRAGIYIDPNTALATIVTDPLPQILEGVPISYRAINATIDRPGFTINPTSCARKQISATVTASNGATASPSTGFQATNCTKLPYAPKLKLRFTGSTKRTGNPGVRAVLTQKPNQANTKAAIVVLPGSQFIDNSHINNPCTRVQFNANACPPKSTLGTIEAKSPLLDAPLKGKLIFRSNGGERELPDIVADLTGPNGIRVIQVGFIDSVKGRVRTRFLSVPDVPLTRIALKFFGGKRGLIENSQNLCASKRHYDLELRAQNGLVNESRPVLKVPCGKGKK